MKRDFLEGLGLEKETIDKIMAENGADLEREKAKTTQAKADLTDVQAQLSQRDADLKALQKTAGDSEEIQKQLNELQEKYTTETEQYKAQIAERDYADAITRSISTKSLKFSSKSAEKAFISSVKEKKLELKDGELQGLDDFIKAQKEADPDAFAPEKPPARVVSGSGSGGEPPKDIPANVAQAKEMGAAKAASMKASNDVLQNYL